MKPVEPIIIIHINSDSSLTWTFKRKIQLRTEASVQMPTVQCWRSKKNQSIYKIETRKKDIIFFFLVTSHFEKKDSHS